MAPNLPMTHQRCTVELPSRAGTSLEWKRYRIRF
jgi:hypothetical protein